MTAEALWLDRFEPLGTNCEFGFVLERLGSKRPSLFRWNSIRPEGLRRALDADFAGAFALENLTPINEGMVRDEAYDWAFHSSLKSDAHKKFVLESRELERLHRIEKIKIETDQKIFRQRLSAGRIVCVLAAQEIADEEADACLLAIDRFSGNASNQLLVVTQPAGAQSEAGRTYRRSARIARAIVARSAPCDQADDADYESWTRILRAVA